MILYELLYVTFTQMSAAVEDAFTSPPRNGDPIKCGVAIVTGSNFNQRPRTTQFTSLQSVPTLNDVSLS